MKFAPNVLSDAEMVKHMELHEEMRRRNKATHRTCGECVACCTILSITELAKPAHTTCTHCAATGCQIYQIRPNSCKGWSCDWILGWQGLTDAQRPDKLGLMFTRDDPNAPLIAYETSPGSSKTKKAQKVLDRLTRQKTVYLNPSNTTERKLVKPPKSQDERLDDESLLDLADEPRRGPISKFGDW